MQSAVLSLAGSILEINQSSILRSFEDGEGREAVIHYALFPRVGHRSAISARVRCEIFMRMWVPAQNRLHSREKSRTLLVTPGTTTAQSQHSPKGGTLSPLTESLVVSVQNSKAWWNLPRNFLCSELGR